jgi:purine-nucleoside phosphorylase
VTHSPTRTAPALSQLVNEAATFVRTRASLQPSVALILGSGLGELADEIDEPAVVPYSDIPHFPTSTVQGHAGELVLGALQGTSVVAMRGRLHFYEGYSLRDVTLPVRVMRRLGAETLIVTNAAGGLNESYRTGDLMLLTDHLNIMGMAGQSPLRGPNEEVLGVRFLDMLHAYDASLRATCLEIARQNGFADKVREGVYAMVGGPAFETMAEIRFLHVARHEHMRVLGISAITDMAVGTDAVGEISHTEVLAAAEEIKPRLATLVRGVVRALAD